MFYILLLCLIQTSKKEGMVNVADKKLTLQVTPLDVIDDNPAKEATKKMQTNKKKIDVLVNNEGYLLLLNR